MRRTEGRASASAVVTSMNFEVKLCSPSAVMPCTRERESNGVKNLRGSCLVS